MDPILAVDGLQKHYGTKVAVDDASFTLSPGEILGLLGPNGAGKTTIIRIIMGIIEAARGSVCLFSRFNPINVAAHRVGYLPEERGLYEDARVLEGLEYLAALKGVRRADARERAYRWLDRLALGANAHQKVEQLSKGMQQKVQFIAAIIHQPELLVLDEPLSGLDPVNQDLFKDLIRELQQRGVGILLSAHQMNVVEEMCDSIYLINRGRQVLYGDLVTIKRDHPETAIDFSCDLGRSDLSFLDRVPNVRVVGQRNGTVSLRYWGAKKPAELVSHLSSRLELEEISIRKPPLHEIFIQAVADRGEEIDANPAG